MSTKRRYNEICRAVHHVKRLKRSSSAASRRLSSELKNACIDDLPDLVLVEILCRLTCHKFVSQCKFVCKRWCTLMSDPCFIGHFLCHQRDRKNTQVTHTLINLDGEEFLNRMSMSSQPLYTLFRNLMNFHHLKEKPVVVGTFNDLVLCCASRYDQRDYYICNPYTIKWVPLPPPPHVYQHTAVGFICDLPYYNCKKEDQGHIIELNAGYRCKVVRLICPKYQTRTFSKEFKLQIFSSEIGEWSESIVLFPSKFRFDDIDNNISFACNGMLYWMGDYCGDEFLIGLDPFMIKEGNNTTSLSCTSSSTYGDDFTDHNYQGHFFELDKSDKYVLQCLGVNGGCLKLCDYDFVTYTLFVIDLKEDQMARIHGGDGKVCCEDMVSLYSLDENMALDDAQELVDMLAFDPNDGDIMYLRIGVHRDIIRCNIRTREWSKIVEQSSIQCCYFLPFAVPLWPTALPRFPHYPHPTPNPLPALNVRIRVSSKVNTVTGVDDCVKKPTELELIREDIGKLHKKLDSIVEKLGLAKELVRMLNKRRIIYS